MIDDPRPLDPPPALYADEDPVYRGARNPNWIIGNDVTENAFFRRAPKPDKNIRGDPGGLSIATNPHDAVQSLKRYHGVIVLRVGSVRGLDDERGVQLDVQPDLIAPNKGNIKNVPYFDDPSDPERIKEALRVAEKLAQIARVHPYPEDLRR